MPGFEMEIAGTTRAQRWPRVPQLTDDEKLRAALTVCDIAGRGLDVEIPEHRAAAARQARPILEVLGLLGEQALRSSERGRGKMSKVVHGTKSAVDAHQDLGQELCPPCRRWAQVDARKHGLPRPFKPELCGSRAGAQQHDDFDQERCEACREADNAYHRRLRAVRAWAIEAGIALPAGPVPRAVWEKFEAAQADGGA